MTWGNITQAEMDEARERARQLVALLAQDPVVADAELAAQGRHPVTIAHGDLHDEVEAHLVYRLLPEAAQHTAAQHSTHGTSGTTTYVFQGPGAQQAAIEFMAAALAIALPWWRIAPSTRPPRPT